ncbi:MAG: A/G-specific adenine glycosylase [Candidatus Aminicenantes bacterium]|nr:A/G-specific adenine glycosylase [Candidatus Aminicenantes bacterium]
MAEKQKTFPAILLRWYQFHHRKMPWRKTRDPYCIWISEIMLQQTTVQAVIPYYEKWMIRFPGLEVLARASAQDVLKAWQGLGYYRRAKNIHKASRIFVEVYEGKIPSDYEELRKVPGFGPYTTAAVLSIAFDLPYPAIDANARRVWMRLSGLRKRSSPQVDQAIQKFIIPHAPNKQPGLFNQAVMELGALVCKPKNPLCHACPVTPFCKAFETGEQEIIPIPKKMNYRRIEAVVAIIEERGRYLIQKRPPEGLLADLWEFPGGKRKPSETLEDALRRELKEELGADVETIVRLTSVKHAYTQFRVTLHAFFCTLKHLPPLSKKRHRWVNLKGMKRYPFPSGSAKIIKFLETMSDDKS